MPYRFISLLVLVLGILFSSCSRKTIHGDQVNMVPGSSPKKSEINKNNTPEILTVPTKNFRKPALPVKDEMPIDHKIKIGTLSNGMKYYIRANKYPEKRVALRLAVAAGSINEDPGQEGMAHFIEHMCFNGTKSFAKDSLVKYLESVGTKFGADLNAYTSFDETVYMLEARTDHLDQLDKGLLILKEWAGDVSLDHDEIDKERGVVISEWRSGLSPEQRMAQNYFPIMYQNSKYAKRLPIGKTEVIKNGEYETFKRFYRDWYRPELMALVVVGDIDVKELELKIKEVFGQLENPIPARPKESSTIPAHDNTLVSINTDAEAPFSTVMIINKFEHKPVLTKRDFKKWIRRSLYNDMLNARLQEITQKKNPPFLYGYSGYGQDVGNLDVFRSFVSVEKGQWLDGMEAILVENKRILKHGFTPTEFERAKARMMQNAEKQSNEKDKLKSSKLAMNYVYHFLDQKPIPNPAQYLSLLRSYLVHTKLTNVNRLAKKWNENKNRVVVLTGPPVADGSLPIEQEIHALIRKVDLSVPTAYVDEISEAKWLSKSIIAGSIKKDSVISNIENLHIVYLDNGIKVYIKSTDFKNDEILMSAWSDGGNSLCSEEDYIQASFTSPVMNQSGVKDFSGIELSKMFAGKNIRLQSYISTYKEGLKGSSSVKDLEWFMQWLNYVFTVPNIDSDAFSAFKTKYSSVYSNLLSDPKYYFQNESAKIKYNNNYRAMMPTSSDIQQLNKDDIFRIHQSRFSNPADFTFCFVGNFEIEEMKEKLKKYLGSLQTNEKFETPKDTKVNLVNGKIEKRWKKGEAPKSYVGITYHGEFNSSKKEKYQFHTMTSILKTKLRERMREEMGGVYGVNVSGNLSKFPTDKYSITIGFVAEPTKVDALILAIKDEVSKLINGNISVSDIDKVLELQKQSKIKKLKENNYWLAQLEYFEESSMHPNEIKMSVLMEKMTSITPLSISQSAKHYFNGKNSIWLIQDPE